MKSISAKKTFKHKNSIIVSSVLLALLMAGALTYIYGFNGSIFGWKAVTSSTDPTSPPTSDQIEDGNQQKKDTINENQQNSGKPSTSKVGDTPNAGSQNLSVTITAANQNDTAFNVRSLINTITNSGDCTLTLTKDTDTVTRVANIQALANSSTCKGFDIPLTELSMGVWQLNLSVETNGQTAVVEKEITIE